MNRPDTCDERRPGALTEASDRLGTRVHFDRQAEIYAQDERTEMFYRVLRGVVRTSKLTSAGRRQVGDFYYAGDLSGLEPGPLHRFAAEALTECEVQVVRRSTV